MSGISNVNNDLLASQLAGLQLRQAIDVQVAAKTMDIARQQGDAVLALLDSAAGAAQTMTADQPRLTLGALVSGLGQNLDVRG
jgi:hypothetical protein